MWEINIDVISATLTREGTLEVVRRERSNLTYGNGSPIPDKISKEIYVAGPDGKIVLQRTVMGTHKPAYKVPESIEFPAEES